MNGLLFSLPGTPVMYYGDEIGMGDNFYLGDRNGVRTPMQWSGDRNAGFSRANPQKLFLPVIVDPEYHYESHNVEAQQGNRHSLLHWMKRLIALRKSHAAFGRGSIEFLSPTNRRVLAFVRRWQGDTILVVANLSRFVEYVELDLSEWKGSVAVELFSRRPFPPIGDLPYLLTLGPHAFYWFSIEEPEARIHPALIPTDYTVPTLKVRGRPEAVFRSSVREVLEEALPQIVRERRWFGAKAQSIRRASISDVVEVATNAGRAYVVVAEVELGRGDRETYVVPTMVATGERAGELMLNLPHAVYAQIEASDRDGEGTAVLYDAVEEAAFAQSLLGSMERRRRFKGEEGDILGIPTGSFRRLRGEGELQPLPLRVEQSNSSVAFGDRLVLKVARRVVDGENPETEIGRFLTDEAGFEAIAPLAGVLEYQRRRHAPAVIGVLQRFVHNEGDAWHYAQDSLRQFFERALSEYDVEETTPTGGLDPLDRAEATPPDVAKSLMGAWLESARLLGIRTAELHRALASAPADHPFAPEPMGALYLRSLYQSLRNLTSRSFQSLEDRLDRLPEAVRDDAADLLADRARVLQVFEEIRKSRSSALRIRVHGDYHLGQVLHTGRDFVLIDFEGEPARSLSERRQKRSALVDVAGMLRSFDYAAHSGVAGGGGTGLVRPQDATALDAWANFWLEWTSSAFLRAYLHTADGAAFLPTDRKDLRLALTVARLEKAVYELGYELNNRPDWVAIPIRGIRHILGEVGA